MEVRRLGDVRPPPYKVPTASESTILPKFAAGEALSLLELLTEQWVKAFGAGD